MIHKYNMCSSSHQRKPHIELAPNSLIFIMRDYNYYVYLLTNYTKKVLYTGVTNNIARRLYEHRYIEKGSFCYRYRCYYLLYYDWYGDISQAIDREKQIKKWGRSKKIRLIKTLNPNMNFLNDLIEDLF
jgi:putative endonuclease